MISINSDIIPAAADAYIVGGSIRDILLERSPADYDFAVPGNPAEFASRLAAKIGGRPVEIGKAGRKIIRVATPRHVVDVAPVCGSSIEDDLKKRDFSIDAMAYHLASGEIIDPFDGRNDLALRQVRMLSKDVFAQDPIRLLRAYRIAAGLGFNVEARTAAAVREYAALIRESAGERIRSELFSFFEAPQSYPYLREMADAGLLFAVFPEMAALKGCRQNRIHAEDVFDHSLQAYEHLERLMAEFNLLEPETAAEAADSFSASGDTGLLKCALLLHDLGKPATKTIDESGCVHFIGHASKGAEIVDRIGSRLKFSRRQKLFLDFIIRQHLRPLSLFTALRHKHLTPGGLMRFYLKCGDHTPHLLVHALADALAKKSDASRDDFRRFIRDLLHRYFTEFKPVQDKPPLVTGSDLIEKFNLTPSARFKKILAAVNEARLSGEINTRAEALRFVNDFLNKQKPD